MHGFNDDTINWLSSDSVWAYYDKMIKRYLKQNNQTDYTKYEFALVGYNPHFIRWEYSDTRKPCINRIRKLANNVFEFDQRTRVTFTNQNINTVRHDKIHLYTREFLHFKCASKFIPPTVSYFVSGIKTNQIVNVIINPLEVKDNSGFWIFFYKISANKPCVVDINFHFKYVYYEAKDDETEPEVVTVEAEVAAEDLPTVETTALSSEQETEEQVPDEEITETATFRSDDDIIVDKSTLQRSASLRSSQRKVKVPQALKDDIKPKTFYAIDNATYKRLTKPK